MNTLFLQLIKSQGVETLKQRTIKGGVVEKRLRTTELVGMLCEVAMQGFKIEIYRRSLSTTQRSLKTV